MDARHLYAIIEKYVDDLNKNSDIARFTEGFEGLITLNKRGIKLTLDWYEPGIAGVKKQLCQVNEMADWGLLASYIYAPESVIVIHLERMVAKITKKYTIRPVIK